MCNQTAPHASTSTQKRLESPVRRCILHPAPGGQRGQRSLHNQTTADLAGSQHLPLETVRAATFALLLTVVRESSVSPTDTDTALALTPALAAWEGLRKLRLLSGRHVYDSC